MAINVPIVSEFEPKGIKKAVKEFKRLEKTSDKVAFAMKKAFVPATAAVAGLGAAAVVATKAAVEDAKQQDELARQLKVTTDATDAQVAAVEDYIAQTEMAAAVSDTELRPAFANLVRATGDVTEAQKLMTLALDVAAGTGKDLETVSEALQEAYKGEVGPLKELDRSLTDLISTGADADVVMGQLADTFGGAAAANTETVAGRFELMDIQIQNAKESIGLALLPILEKLLPVLEDVATFVSENTDLIVALGAVIGTVAGIVIAYNAAMTVYAAVTGIASAATAVFNAVMAANPIVLVAMAVAAFIVALVALEKKFGVITKVVEGAKIAFDKLSDAVKWLAGKFVDFINTLIDVANKIPFVSIEKLNNIFEDQTEYVEAATGAVAMMKTPLQEIRTAFQNAADEAARGNMEYETAQKMMDDLRPSADDLTDAMNRQWEAVALANIEYETAQQLMDELHPTEDDVTAAIQRMNDAMDKHIRKQEIINGQNTDLIDTFDRLFDRFDNRRIVQDFSDAIDDAREAISKYGDKSVEAIKANEDLYIALGRVINELDNIPATTQLQLIAQLDQGQYDEVLQKLLDLQKLADLGFKPIGETPFMEQGRGLNAPAQEITTDYRNAAAMVGGSPMVVNYYAPAGQDADEAINTLQRGGRRVGTLNVPVSGNIQQ